MPALNYDQIRVLNSYSVFTEDTDRPLFTMENLHKDFFIKDFRNLMMGITQATTEAAAISHFGRRYGMFVAMQFYMLSTYDEIWDGKLEDIRFSLIHEFGNNTLGTFITAKDFRYVDDHERASVIQKLLIQCHLVFQQLRKATSVSPLTLWENVFGYMLWNYYEMLENPLLADRALEDIEILEDTKVWQLFSNKSLFYQYTEGKNPSELVNRPVRKSCCFSKDIPGLITCEHCPMK
ncbi:Fe-S oxidoreductase [Lysinibacillus sp. BW-2-10]|uniref:Fe-S oxidoreductase n=1 Tax=Lysinibacillus sp. BW-2-10 TaxID=2590030 RepID=UPI00117E91BD|nr:Fe-S oxidoreductase [Lysinibacillus sp. BW-2-10]TSI06016.1 Fe-S oxidoreductase [Lysinibacillus sp. BW-2-10]